MTEERPEAAEPQPLIADAVTERAVRRKKQLPTPANLSPLQARLDRILFQQVRSRQVARAAVAARSIPRERRRD